MVLLMSCNRSGHSSTTLRQDNLLASSSVVLADAVDHGQWGSTISNPAVELLDGVLGSVDVENENTLERIGGK